MRSYALATAFAGAATAFQTSSVDSWSDNPTNLGSTIVLTPDSMGDSPALILGLHPCGGTGSLYQSMTTLPDYIDELNFIMLFPTSNVEDGFNCWDAYSSATLTHDGGGDSEGLAGLVNWAIDEYGVDTSRVFMIGASSGAMETNVLAGSYPDLFAAGISYSGVPDGCWAGASSSTPLASDQSCPLGSKASTYTAEQWADLVYDSYPGYEGPWPRMQIVHGTADFAVTINNLNAQLEQWSTVHGVSFSQNVTNDPISGWTKIEYGDGTEVVGYEVAGGGHIPPFQIDITLDLPRFSSITPAGPEPWSFT
ncbi:carbohydrate esterase family 1 protein [Xylariomycetidae sp. FL0641]|nr:carbohydrate esterase family 1 protein [Xylariomycetidae sp. FL0641]